MSVSSYAEWRKKSLVGGDNLTKSRPVAGGGAGRARAPPEIFRLELISATKVEFAAKIESCQWKLKFQSIVDHSKIMYPCSSTQFGIVERNEIVFLLCQKQPTALKYLLITH